MNQLAYFPQKWKPIKREIIPDPPKSPAGRKPVEIPAAVESRIIELRERGETLAKIAGVLSAEFGIQLPISTLSKLWIERLEPQTDEGRQIARLRNLFGLSRMFWKKYLADERRREALESGRSSSPGSSNSPATGPPAPPPHPEAEQAP